MNKVEYLSISSTLDFSTDLVCCEFERRGLNYLRLNRDQFLQYQIEYNLQDDAMEISFDSDTFSVDASTLKSVFFRAPVFLRNTNKQHSLNDQVYRSQWSSFIRNMIVFTNALWMNHPVSTYRAENKLYQLKLAKEYGLTTPVTWVANHASSHIKPKANYIIKSIDTALFHDSQQEYFTYSTQMSGQELIESELRLAPVIIQEFLSNKTDIRATIVDNAIFAAAITTEGRSIEGDWRKTNKDKLTYTPIELPQQICNQLLKLMHALSLSFGGVDLALVGGQYYFIEVNPTGEWGWLSTNSIFPIEKEIVDALSQGEYI